MEAKPRLPSGVQGPYVNDEFGDVYGTVITVSGDSSFSDKELTAISEDLRDKLLKQVDEIGKIKLYGDLTEKVYIYYDNEKLAQLKLTPEIISDAVKSRNSMAAAGEIVDNSSKLIFTFC